MLCNFNSSFLWCKARKKWGEVVINLKCHCWLCRGRERGWRQVFFHDFGTDYPLLCFASPADVIDPSPSLCKLPPALGGISCLSCRGNACVTLSCVLMTCWWRWTQTFLIPAGRHRLSSCENLWQVTGSPWWWMRLLWACWHQQQYNQDLDQVGMYVCICHISSWHETYAYLLLLRLVTGMKTPGNGAGSLLLQS